MSRGFSLSVRPGDIVFTRTVRSSPGGGGVAEKKPPIIVKDFGPALIFSGIPNSASERYPQDQLSVFFLYVINECSFFVGLTTIFCLIDRRQTGPVARLAQLRRRPSAFVPLPRSRGSRDNFYGPPGAVRFRTLAPFTRSAMV